MSAYVWQWPCIGPTATSEGLDSEIFDTREVPHAHTFVREAIQNSLDARLDNGAPVRVHFTFHHERLGQQGLFLSDLRSKKAACNLPWPHDWDEGRVSWLLIEDFNTTGLRGDIEKRTSDFWNYWLNFGISNKSGTGRGGRGIGRVTFLIASRIHTVIGLTRRDDDGQTVACGMSVMRMHEDQGDVRSSYGYLAASERKNTFDLYGDAGFIPRLVDSFGFANRSAMVGPGFSLAIPYPRQELTPQSIQAAVIEHFGPAIIDGDLIVEVDGHAITPHSIDNTADNVSAAFQAAALREGAIRVLDLQRRATEVPDFKIRVKDLSSLPANLSVEEQDAIRQTFEAKGYIVLDLSLPVERNGTKSSCGLRAALAKAPHDKPAADYFFRGGMLLPAVSARRPSDVDLVCQTRGTNDLVVYLNFCEGKAHLDLTENHEVKAKLDAAKFSQGYQLKRFVKRLMEELRTAVLPDATKPDASVFARFFAAPKAATPTGERRTRPKPGKNIVIVDAPPARIPAFSVDQLTDGFRVSANSAFQDWPVVARISVAYADGSRKPKWSRFDFDLARLKPSHQGAASVTIKDNMIIARDCGPGFALEVAGFDTSRELITNIDSRRIAISAKGQSADA